MRRTMLKSKIHRATLTECFLEYEGSIAIDSDLLKAADILPGELVHVLNVNNGRRDVRDRGSCRLRNGHAQRTRRA